MVLRLPDGYGNIATTKLDRVINFTQLVLNEPLNKVRPGMNALIENIDCNHTIMGFCIYKFI